MGNENQVQLVDCPRDAIQGMQSFLPTEKKVGYIRQLLASGCFDFIDFGSFVSPKAVPQMADTAEVIQQIEEKGLTKLIAIIANEKGAALGKKYELIDYLGYPFSISDTFQRRNTNRSTNEAFETVIRCQESLSNGPELMVYLSMAFGNPYGDHWDEDIVFYWVEKLANVGIRKFSLADTTAEATPARIEELFSGIQNNFSGMEWSIHLHSRVENALLKVEAAYRAGCRIFEGAMMGYGGCPFAQDDLVGNIPSELLIDRFGRQVSTRPVELMEAFQQLIHHEL